MMDKKFSALHLGGAFVAGILVGAGGAAAVGEATDSIRTPEEREAAQKAREQGATAKK